MRAGQRGGGPALPAGRRAGGRPVWLGLVDDYALDLLQDWLHRGGPGLAALPDLLALQQFPRPAPAEA